MTALLLSRTFAERFGKSLESTAREAGIDARAIHLPEDGSGLTREELRTLDAAYLDRAHRFSPTLYSAFSRAVEAAPNLKWVHFSSAGIDAYPFLEALRSRGVKLTASSGSNSEPVAQTAVTGLLMLARGFPKWLDAQRRRAWEPIRGAGTPRDLSEQTVLVVGLGNIGAHVARFCQGLGLHVIGVRRRPRAADDPVDEMHTLTELPSVLPRCDFVVLTCPLTSETQHLVNERTLALLPRGAKVINVSRGAVIDEPALVRALQSGHLGGAYLDVFETEPLPADSPLWDHPTVIVSPHNAQASAGNDARAAELFIGNLVRLARGEPLANGQ